MSAVIIAPYILGLVVSDCDIIIANPPNIISANVINTKFSADVSGSFKILQSAGQNMLFSSGLQAPSPHAVAIGQAIVSTGLFFTVPQFAASLHNLVSTLLVQGLQSVHSHLSMHSKALQSSNPSLHPFWHCLMFSHSAGTATLHSCKKFELHLFSIGVQT